MRSGTVALISHSFRFVVRKYFHREAEWMQYTLRGSYGKTILFFSLESLSREKADKLMAVTRRIEVRRREEAQISTLSITHEDFDEVSLSIIE